MNAAPKIPHDIGAERAILGAAFLSPDTVAEAAAMMLEVESFYREPHRALWRAMLHVDQHSTLDLVTVAGRLEQQGKLEEIGGYSYLAGLAPSAPSVANVGAYVETVLKHARARDLLVACGDATGRVYSGEDADDARADLAARLVNGSEQAPTCDDENATVNSIWEKMRSGVPPDTYLSSPWRLVNAAVRGIYRGELAIVVGQPATGKSVFCDQYAVDLALRGIPGCVFALEMTHEQMTIRRLANLARADYSDLQDFKPRSDEIVALDEARERLASAPIWTDDGMLTMEQIWSRTKAGVRRHGWEWIVIDHAHTVKASDGKADRNSQLEHIGLIGKQIAKDCKVAALMAAQMNSDIKKRKDKRPQRGDIAYGSTMEQNAATVLGLHREELHNRESMMRGVAEVIPIKTRFGRGDDVKLRWVGSQQRFTALLDEEESWIG